MQTITRGFIAIKGSDKVEYKLAISNVAFMITSYQNGEVLNQVPRTRKEAAEKYINNAINKLVGEGYTIEEIDRPHKIREKDGFYKVSL